MAPDERGRAEWCSLIQKGVSLLLTFGSPGNLRSTPYPRVMANTAQDVLRRIKDEGIELIDLKFVDLHGKWQHLTVCNDQIGRASCRERV